MELRTRFTEAFGLSTPIAQAGMAFVGMTPDLAVAVSNAGALGSLGVGLMPAPALAQTVAAIQAGTSRPFHVNLITPLTGPAQLDAVCAAGVAAASFHWGHPPRAWIDQLHGAGVRVLEQIGSVADARVAEIPADTSSLPVVGHVELGGQHLELHRFSSFVPMRDLTTGDLEEMPLLAGQGVGLVGAATTAAAVVAAMTALAVKMLDRHRVGITAAG